MRKDTGMARALRGMLWVAGVAVVMGVMACGAESAKDKNKAAQPAPAAPDANAPAADEKVAYTFTDDAKIQEFAQLWQQRQGTLVRMTVLQSYLSQEQADLAKLNQTITSTYKLDPSKSYFLDAKRRVLIERDLPVDGPDAQSAAPAPAPNP